MDSSERYEIMSPCRRHPPINKYAYNNIYSINTFKKKRGRAIKQPQYLFNKRFLTFVSFILVVHSL